MKDYLVELLSKSKWIRARATAQKQKQQEYHDQDEFECLMQLERDLDFVMICIEQMTQENKEIIEFLYFKNYSLAEYAKVKRLTKAGAQSRKKVAIRELRAIFE